MSLIRLHCGLFLISAPILAALPIVVSAGAAQESAAGAETVPAAQVYDSSASVPTNISGIMTFADPPEGFNAVTATPEQRAQYGFPPAPDQVPHPSGYALWKKAMTAASHGKRWNGQLKVTNLKSTPARMGTPLSPAPPATEGVPNTGAASFNWSGIVNTSTVTRFGAAKFDEVLSEFTVPSAQEPYGICDSSQDYYAAVWNGIDGFSTGDLLQAGTLSYATCSGGLNSPSYISWIEWYPSYPILEAYSVNPGDVVFIETYATSATQGYLYVYDYYLQLFASYSLAARTTPYLVGSSAEYIVERPCCNSAGHPLALANYLESPAWEQYNYTGKGVLNYTGNTSSKTYWVSMLDDPGDQYISFPYAVGIKSPYSTAAEAVTVFAVENCAYSGGCAQN